MISRWAMLALALLVSPSASTQTLEDEASGDFSAGYALLRGDESLDRGWTLGLAGRVSQHVWIVGDAGGHYRSGSSQHELTLGPRFRYHLSPITPFAQITGGFAYSRRPNGDLAPLLQMGVGADFLTSDVAALRVQADWLMVREGSQKEDWLRLSFSLAYRP